MFMQPLFGKMTFSGNVLDYIWMKVYLKALNKDLFKLHVADSPSCRNPIEDAIHYVSAVNKF